MLPFAPELNVHLSNCFVLVILDTSFPPFVLNVTLYPVGGVGSPKSFVVPDC